MSVILEAMPGTPLRVSEVMPALAKYWQDAAEGRSSSRASQMNLVVVFGKRVTPEDALKQMEQAFTLSRRYPCRIIALCPNPDKAAQLEGKLHIACFPSTDGRERRCGEVLLLGYPASIGHDYLENQVSVWLESDIPVYTWFHNVDASELAEFDDLARTSRRVVYDSSICTGDFSKVAWPKPDIVRDLAHARLLAVRQALGQFLSAYSPAALAEGLERVTVNHAASRCGEARSLSDWMRRALEEVSRRTGKPLKAEFLNELRTDCDACLTTEWKYANGGSFRWVHAPQGSGARIEADIAGMKYSHPLRVPFLDQPAALAEALFF